MEQIISSNSTTNIENLTHAYELSFALYNTFELISRRLSNFLALFSLFYLNFETFACQILSHGFVNAIPKMVEKLDKTEEIEGENCGMGEGEGGQNNVSNQIENLEQVEGLKVTKGYIFLLENLNF